MALHRERLMNVHFLERDHAVYYGDDTAYHGLRWERDDVECAVEYFYSHLPSRLCSHVFRKCRRCRKLVCDRCLLGFISFAGRPPSCACLRGGRRSSRLLWKSIFRDAPREAQAFPLGDHGYERNREYTQGLEGCLVQRV